MERYRKKHKKSIKHWLVTELGHDGTENIHLHGILWTYEKNIEKYWQYGYVWDGYGDKKVNYVNERTVNYIMKYVTKLDLQHKLFESKILTSAGIGKNYTNRSDAKLNKYNKLKTNETYKTKTGHKTNLPIYYRNKIYTEEEREQLWLEKLDKQTRYVCGEKIDISKNDDTYYNILKFHRERNKRLGYGDDEINWEKKLYEQQRRNIKIKERIDRTGMPSGIPSATGSEGHRPTVERHRDNTL